MYSAVSANMNSAAEIKVEFGSEVTLSNAFSQGYNQGDLIQFTISGIQNPAKLDITDPITVKIFYSELESDINVYSG